MLSVIGAGCILLATPGPSGNVACYSGYTLYCSDVQVGALPTCAEWNHQFIVAQDAMKKSGCMSQDGSTSTCAWIGPTLPGSHQ
jgi:hypothetical protein